MAVGDIDGDGKDEVILAIADIVYLLDNNFSTIKEISVPVVSDEFNYLQVATADYDQDGIDEWILVKGSSKQNRVATWHIYKNTVEWKTGTISSTDSQVALRTANVVTGDFDGDGLPETAFLGKENRSVPRATSNNDYYLHILDTEMDQDSKVVFTLLTQTEKLVAERTYVQATIGSYEWQIPALAAGDMDMDGKDEIFAINKVFNLNSSKVFETPREALIKSGFCKATVFGEGAPGQEAEIRPLPALLRHYSGLFPCLMPPLFPLRGFWAH